MGPPQNTSAERLRVFSGSVAAVLTQEFLKFTNMAGFF